MRFTVAIDGPAAAGKGTISRAVAAQFGFAHLDTGLLYRAVGAMVLEGADPVAAAQALAPGDLERPGLRGAEAAEAASKVAAIPEVRAALVAFQRSFARRVLMTTKPVAAGERFTRDNVDVLRRGKLEAGLAPKRLDEVLASVAARAIAAETPLTEADLAHG